MSVNYMGLHRYRIMLEMFRKLSASIFCPYFRSQKSLFLPKSHTTFSLSISDIVYNCFPKIKMFIDHEENLQSVGVDIYYHIQRNFRI